ncbi:MAG TPA: sigma-70 family RNA polymerase sigma factor [Candidatus Nanoarchaeia archaeon]|nr:sigma-70 family RNA polymerase sigma factor [Candidatus Nanoarchaeia archaeon]
MKGYIGRDDLSTKVREWQNSEEKFPDKIWEEAYVVDRQQGIKWQRKFWGIDIEDPVQDVAIATPQIAGEYRGEAKFSTVLIGTLQRRAIEYIRDRKKRNYEPHGREYYERRARNNTPDVAEQVQYKELSELVSKALEKMSPNEASIITYAMNKISYAVIAQIMETTLDGVKSGLRRARVRFYHILGATTAGRDYLEESVPARYGVKKRRRSNVRMQQFSRSLKRNNF